MRSLLISTNNKTDAIDSSKKTTIDKQNNQETLYTLMSARECPPPPPPSVWCWGPHDDSGYSAWSGEIRGVEDVGTIV